MKTVLCISLSIMCLFTCVGYASVTDILFVRGEAEVSRPNALLIIGVNGGNYINPNTLAFTGTVVTSDLVLMKNSSGVYEASFEIEVLNNTSVSYYYHSMIHGTYTTESGEAVAYSNDDIVLTVDKTTLKKADEIKPGESKTFRVVASFKDGVNSATASKELFSVINYYFSTTQPDPDDESGGEAAVSGVLARFPELLNDPEDYSTLTKAMDSNSTHSDYIGNVVSTISSWDDDTKAVQDLFGVALELNIDGENKPVTVIIQRKNVDANKNTGDTFQHVVRVGALVLKNEKVNGAEMVLFMTPVNPKTVSAGSYIETYAVVYTKNGNGSEWYQLGDVYKGTARVVGYVSGWGIANDSIDPSSWRQENTNKTIEQITQGK